MYVNLQDGVPHFWTGTTDVRARAYDFNVRFLPLRVLPSQRFFFPGRAAVNHAVWLAYVIPGAVSCPCSSGYLLLGLIIICSKVCGWMLLRLLRLLRSDTFSHFCESIQFLGGSLSLSKHTRRLNVQSFFLLLDKPLCQPRHLVGITQSRV
jgi:hypothetical protein